MSAGYDISSLLKGIAAARNRIDANTRAAAGDVAAFLAAEGKDHAPLDEGHLTGDITPEVTEQNGKTYAAAYIPANAASAPYAVAMHEAQYNPGPGSREKARRLGGWVGPKFLTRPMYENAGRIKDLIAGREKL